MTNSSGNYGNFLVISWNVLHIVHEINYSFHQSPVISLFGIEEDVSNEQIRLREIAATLEKILTQHGNKESFVCLQEVPGDLIPLLYQMIDSLKLKFPGSNGTLHQSIYPRVPKIRNNLADNIYANTTESLVILHFVPNGTLVNLQEDQVSTIPCPTDNGKAAQVLKTKTGFVLINIHLPYRSPHAESLLHLIPWSLSQHPFVIVGDMNHSIESLLKILKTNSRAEAHMKDLVPITTNTRTRIGYDSYGHMTVLWIDFYLISKILATKTTGVAQVWEEAENISDHFPIILEFGN